MIYKLTTVTITDLLLQFKDQTALNFNTRYINFFFDYAGQNEWSFFHHYHHSLWAM